MKAVVITETEGPKYSEFENPASGDKHIAVDVCAAALTNLDIATAEGRHYFAHNIRPFVVGREALTRHADENRYWYNIYGIVAPFGSMAERTLVRPEFGLLVPIDTPDVIAAAIGNAGLAGWLPLSWRARMQVGESVMVLGATGTSGMIAVAAAKILGAKHVVAVGRNTESLERAKQFGADAIVNMTSEDDLPHAFREATEGGVDIVIDYLNGAPAEAALEVLNVNGRIVQIGQMAGTGIHLPAQLPRKQSLDLLGFAYYHAPIDAQRAAYTQLCEHAMRGEIPIDTVSMPLSSFDAAWTRQKHGSRSRIVLIP